MQAIHILVVRRLQNAILLVGLKIERGFTRKVSERIGGSEGSIHLKELTLETISFAAIDLIGYDEGIGLMRRDFNLLDENKKIEISQLLLNDNCYVFKSKQCSRIIPITHCKLFYNF